VTADKLIGSKELRILLAEDNPVNQRLAVRLLEKLGHKVAVVSSGVAVVSQVAEQQFDLILMDIQMPEMDGFAATAAIRSLAPNPMANVPIVAMTAHAMNGARERCLEAGMDDYIAKPISMAIIQDTIAGILESRSTAAEDTTLDALSPDAGTAGERAGKSLMKQGSGSHD
jgi:CheY-like chemotaxis protein